MMSLKSSLLNSPRGFGKTIVLLGITLLFATATLWSQTTVGTGSCETR